MAKTNLFSFSSIDRYRNLETVRTSKSSTTEGWETALPLTSPYKWTESCLQINHLKDQLQKWNQIRSPHNQREALQGKGSCQHSRES